MPDRLNSLTVSRPASLSAKCTRGVLGALCTRICLVRRPANSSDTFGEEVEDLSEGLRGLPLDRMMEVDGVRGREEVRGGEGGARRPFGESGEDLGKGTPWTEEDFAFERSM